MIVGLLAVLALLLAVDLGTRIDGSPPQAAAPEIDTPWIVTGWEFPAGATDETTVHYTAPGGRIGTWRMTNSLSGTYIQCFKRVTVGQPLPDCFWSLNRLTGSAPR